MIRSALWSLVIASMLTCLTSAASARCNVLPAVHGYNTGKATVVPLRGVAEWLGAQVQFKSPQITISYGSQRISMRLGSRAAQVNGRTIQMSAPAKAYGGITCVPLRAVSEALGVAVTYHPHGTPQIASASLATLQANGRVGNVIVHVLPPNEVAKIVTLYAGEMDTYHGDNAVIWVLSRDAHGAKAMVINWNDQTGTYDFGGRPDVLWVRNGVWEMGCYVN
ncbi:MAG: copper amine oxidase N-terminal domain-containing protein [Armatimonadia bacterium]